MTLLLRLGVPLDVDVPDPELVHLVDVDRDVDAVLRHAGLHRLQVQAQVAVVLVEVRDVGLLLVAAQVLLELLRVVHLAGLRCSAARSAPHPG